MHMPQGILNRRVARVAPLPVKDMSMTARKATTPDQDPLLSAATALGRDMFARSVVLVFDASTQSLRQASVEAISLLELSEDALSGARFTEICGAEGQDVADIWWARAAGGTAEWTGHLTATLSMTETPVRFRALPVGVEGEEPREVAVVAEPAAAAAPAGGAPAQEGSWTALQNVVGLIEYDADGNVLLANDRACMALEFYGGDLAGRNHDTLWPPARTATPDYIEFWEKLRQGRIVEGRHPHVSSEGNEVWLQSTFVPVRGADGAVGRVIQCLMDVTEDGMAAARNGRQLDALVSGLAVIEYDPEGHVLSANGAALAALGQAADAIVGTHHRRLMDAEFARSKVFVDCWAAALQGVAQFVDIHHVRKDRDSLWTRSALLPVNSASGAVERLIEVCVDIHEMRERLGALDLRHTATTGVMAIMEIDLAGKITAANPMACSLFDAKRADLCALNYQSLLPQEFGASQRYRTFVDRMARGETVSGTFERVRPNGSVVWVRCHHLPLLREGQDAPDGVMILMSDATEEQLRHIETESKLAAIERSMAIAQFDLDGTIEWANGIFTDAMGYTVEELRGRNISSIILPEQAEWHRVNWDRLVKGEFFDGEAQLIGSQGREVWMRGAFNPVFGGDGKVVRIIAFTSVITMDKLHTHDLEEKWRGVSQAVAAAEFDPDGRVLSASDGFLRMIGYSLREIVGQHHSMFCSADHVRTEEYRDFWLSLGKGEGRRGRFHHVARFDRDLHVMAHYGPIRGTSGQVEKVLMCGYEVSDHMALRQEVSQMAERVRDEMQNILHSHGALRTGAAELSSKLTRERGTVEAGSTALQSGLTELDSVKGAIDSVSQITEVLRDIAVQTNLLAFNAAIEAARAGEHGIGFSVVADDVRKLAESNSVAARDIGRHLQAVSESLARGRENATQTLDMVSEVAGDLAADSERVARLVGECDLQVRATDAIADLVDRLRATAAA
jgi:methyl-accepting chemotaxis protein